MESLNTASTTSNDVILLPESQEQWYKLPGYTSTSKEIVSTDLKNPLILSSGQELRIWYGEDLFNRGPHEYDNSGTTCADVHVNYQLASLIPVTQKLHILPLVSELLKLIRGRDVI